MLSTISVIAYILFFASYGINYFWPFSNATTIIAISALVIAVIAVIGLIRSK